MRTVTVSTSAKETRERREGAKSMPDARSNPRRLSRQASKSVSLAARRASPAASTRLSVVVRRGRLLRTRAEEEVASGALGADLEPKQVNGAEGEEEELSESDKLRAAERFMVMDLGTANCLGCGYVYDKNRGDPDYPIPAGMTFSQLPGDWCCPICGADKAQFQNNTKTVAGFAENQGYGLGTNTMTGDQKLLLIYGSLLFFFGLFLAGYAMG